jgi:hypothetical protein
VKGQFVGQQIELCGIGCKGVGNGSKIRKGVFEKPWDRAGDRIRRKSKSSSPEKLA